MEEILKELIEISIKCEETIKLFESDEIESTVTNLQNAINEVGKARSGSWLGYHSLVYYKDFKTPPAGCHFSSEWGFGDYFSNPTTGDWVEYTVEYIEKAIMRKAKNPNIELIKERSQKGKEIFEDCKEKFLINIEALLTVQHNSFLENIKEESSKIKIITQVEMIKYLTPKGQFITRDSLAMSQGIKTPPHLGIYCELQSYLYPKEALEDLLKLVNRTHSYIERKQNIAVEDTVKNDKKVFIGHGNSKVWRDLKEFLQDRLNLPCDEFNRESTAGYSITERLSIMLDEACFAFIIMTAEDQHEDKNLHARENVIHEAGLFQGRLGFKKAIILLEEGCTEFSNIHGLVQIRFPKDNIEAKFEDIRKVLERENII